jgi:hypothetical protein
MGQTLVQLRMPGSRSFPVLLRGFCQGLLLLFPRLCLALDPLLFDLQAFRCNCLGTWFAGRLRRLIGFLPFREARPISICIEHGNEDIDDEQCAKRDEYIARNRTNEIPQGQ